MKIVMLGHTGVGKTTYMNSLYGLLQNEINGFTLSTENLTDHMQLWSLYKQIQDGTYPAATMQRGQYNFLLRYWGKNAFPFTWIDYRGGALRERSDSAETQQLIRELKEATGIILFCDAAMTSGRLKIQSQFGRMMNLVQRAIQDDDSPTIIVIAFTKIDMVDELSDDLAGPAINLMEMIHSSEQHVGTITSIACNEQFFVNVEIPALFILHFGIMFEALVHFIRKDHYQKEEKRLQQAGYASQARMAQQKVDEEQQEAQRLLSTMKGLGEVLTQRLPIIAYGEQWRALFSSDE